MLSRRHYSFSLAHWDVVSGFGWGGGKIKTIVAVGDAAAADGAARCRKLGGGGWGRGIPSHKKIFADLSLKEAFPKHFKMLISLLCFNTIVSIIQVLRTNFLKQNTRYITY